MKIANDFHRYEAARQIYSVLVMHFQEGITQSEIARVTGLSHAKVNRLIKQGREMGMVEINIRSPYQGLFDLETRLKAASGLETVRITPAASQNPQTILKQVGAAAASLLLETLKDGDTVCITGGRGLSAVVVAQRPRQDREGRRGRRAAGAPHRRRRHGLRLRTQFPPGCPQPEGA
jgi:DNA-binding transcriptional regulator LsrR (DeoR family)